VLSRNGWNQIPYDGETLEVIGVDQHGTLYGCGQNVDVNDRVECQAVSPASGSVTWSLPREGDASVVGGALVHQRLCLVTAGGRLFAVIQRGASR
jgi:hypothetical protein